MGLASAASMSGLKRSPQLEKALLLSRDGGRTRAGVIVHMRPGQGQKPAALPPAQAGDKTDHNSFPAPLCGRLALYGAGHAPGGGLGGSERAGAGGAEERGYF